eukprot:TRINITY_DN5802_c1_g1_i1.p1 TRINITY_DN5802_c1_g1~~TRINITY_DN5802_c1_g1_i1.p1  ORF type:complete len:463 (+),score=33.36 TRINITY_DN5802_c1_g1_i1:77-1465(+)
MTSMHDDSVQETIPLPGDDSQKKTQRKHTLGEMLGLFALSFSYGFLYNSIIILVIPSEVQRLSPHKQSVWVSLIMGGGAISQLASPVIGAWSDRTNKRVSILFYGTFLAILGIIGFIIVRIINSMWVLLLSNLVTMIGLAIIYSMLCVLLNDCILPEQVGAGSGALAILGTIGSGCGYGMFAAGIPLVYTYTCYILSCLACLGVSLLFIPSNLDAMLSHAAEQLQSKTSSTSTDSTQGGQLSLSQLFLSAVSLPSPSRYPDFSFACFGRLLFNSGLAAQVYMAYYFRDVLKASDPTKMVSMVAVMSLVGCTLAALPAGFLSDRVGKKPVIYVGISICVSAILSFLVLESIETLLLLGVYYGIGNIAYLSVDYAVGVAALPRAETEEGTAPIDAAKDLGIFSMSASLGSVMGQVLYGAVLDIYSNDMGGATSYSSAGFAVVFSLAALFFTLSGLSVRWIKCVR